MIFFGALLFLREGEGFAILAGEAEGGSGAEGAVRIFSAEGGAPIHDGLVDFASVSFFDECGGELGE